MVSQRVGGALTGALSGAGAGSAFGPIGAGVGGLVGGLGGYFSSKGRSGGSGKSLFETGDKENVFDRYTPEQQNLLSQLLGALTGQGGGPQGGLLGDLFGEKGFQNFAAPLQRQFQEEIVPGLAERFSGLGAQRSSGFNQALARAGQDLTTQLGELRGKQQQQFLPGLLGQLLAPQFERYFQPSGPSGVGSFLGQAGAGLASGAGSALGSYFANKFGGGR